MSVFNRLTNFIKSRKPIEEIYCEVEVRDENGKLLKFKRFKAHSWLKQYYGLVKGLFANPYGGSSSGNVSITDISGTNRDYPTSISYVIGYIGMSILAAVGDVSYGLVIGTSDTANTINTYNMGGIITHGSGSGQMLYGGITIENPTNPSGNDWIFRIIRVFTNNSGASITVKEIGIIVRVLDSTNNARSFLIARDVISAGVTVPNGSTLTVRYIPKITVA
jgi:hypothetical protein